MKKYIFIVGLLYPLISHAQELSGVVKSQNNEPLIGANIYWINSDKGTVTDAEGKFEISLEGITDQILVASFIGYKSDTVLVEDHSSVMFILFENNALQQVYVTARKEGVIIDDTSPFKIEQITPTELRKAACCDLAGCFETQTTVHPQTTNVITNSKELRILGLPGVYSQVLVDGFPMIQGLSFTYGISSIPGSLVGNIFISKGANSVLQGFESISGQLLVETKDPTNSDPLFLNAYANSFGEKHINANFTFKKSKWSNLSSIHIVRPANRIDRDDDGFMDLPLLSRYLFFNKWKYGDEKDWGWSSQIGMRLLHEQRVGGQISFDPSAQSGSTDIYGQNVRLSQPEIMIKTAYRLNDRHRLAFQASAFQQRQGSFFGSTIYDAQQANLFANLQYEFYYGENSLKTGFSYRHLHLQEEISFTDTDLLRTFDGSYNRLENIPGVYAENTLNLYNNQLTWIAGMRLDHHNEYGKAFTPRTTIKYDLSPTTIIRGNVGTGWRTVNLFSENIGLLASSRNIVFTERLLPERALNYGVNLMQRFESGDEDLVGYVSADIYRTNFQNQIFPDFDTDPTQAFISNFTGKSVSNGIQTELSLKLYQRFEWKARYKFLDVYQEIEGSKELLPFNPRHKVVNTFSYQPMTERYQVDFNIHWFGEQRLPNTQANPMEFQRPDFSEPFTVVNMQLTYNFSKFDIYAGCENIFDFRQLQPIISWENPFSPYFDTSSVWGPTRGREFYTGIRFSLN
ncbi:MAG: TonB-dependent receptor [Cyclobacteriaceae bacterium]|nr:TonB-dependent receptor [Cyclobacteriaceae bacterium]MCH8517323.1 TonB-dependent receptor [Cyclobacteriaceae bacterium]